jgi:thioredoxin-like negative regulator of GroEL
MLRFLCYTLSLLCMAEAFQPTTPAALRSQLLSGSAGHTSSSACFVSISINEVYGNGLSSLTGFAEQAQKPKTDDMPALGDDGIYQIETQAQYAALLQGVGKDQIVILKCFAPWCRACKALAPKFMHVSHDPKYKNLPIVWADLNVQSNKDLVQTLGVKSLPTIQFYVAGQLQDSFQCGPSKVPILKLKLAAMVNEHVHAATRKLKDEFLTHVFHQQQRA